MRLGRNSLCSLACVGYGNLCAFITKLRRSSEKGTYRLLLSEIDGKELTKGAASKVATRLEEKGFAKRKLVDGSAREQVLRKRPANPS